MEKKYEEFVFKKKDLEIVSDDGTRYFVIPETDVCLYKIPYCPDGEAEEFYMHETKSHGMQYYNYILEKVQLNSKYIYRQNMTK